MKVLQIIDSIAPDRGGAQRLVLDLHRRYGLRGIDSYVLSIAGDPVEGVPGIGSLSLRSVYHWQVGPRLFWWLLRSSWRHADVIHIHLFPAQLITPPIVRAAGIRSPLVTTEHSSFNRRRRLSWFKPIDAFMYSWYRRVICNSTGTQRSLASWLPKLAKKLVTVENGVDLEQFRTVRSAKGVRNDCTVVISLGRLVALKNYSVAIRALAEIRDIAWEYWIVGGMPSAAMARNLAELTMELNLADRVKFLGYRNDVPALLSQANIFLLTSLWEGFGLGVVEAMAAGLPVVVSDIPGVGDIVDAASGAGLLVNPHKVDAVAAALKALLSDPDRRIRMGEQARKRSARFSLDRMVDGYVAEYTKLVPVASGRRE